MSESVPPSQQPERAPEPTPVPAPEHAPGAGFRGRKGLVRLVPRRRGARWAALGAAVVLVAGGVAVAAVAVADRHSDRRPVGAREFRISYEGGDRRGGPGPGEHRAGERRERTEPGVPAPRDGSGDGGLRPAPPKGAPAPLPSLGIAEAAGKAAGAVGGGKVESLRVVGQEGGGSAWAAVVLGPDGVRHAVTVSGTDGTVTGNTVISGR
ncbi:hypothetical protein ACFWSF_11195 [Streptomyces sp. NPDC058611]|uniref:hypothetical protein n=1 Tax=unclassified Streptomyces TaxID=2593676 RepID=UPI00364F5ED6